MPYRLQESQELRAQRRVIGEQVRALYDKAKTEKRELSAEEDAQVDKMLADSETIKVRYERMERADGLLEDIAPAPAGTNRRAAPPDPSHEETETEQRAKELEKQSAAERRKIGSGPRDTPEYRRIFADFLGAPNSHAAHAVAQRAHGFLVEHRDLSVGVDADGGYLVPPEQFVAELIKEIDDSTFLTQWCRTFTVRQSKSLGAPKRTAKASTWARGAEVKAPTADSSFKLGKRALEPDYLSGLIKVSRDFLRSSILSGEEIVRTEMGRDGAEVVEQELLTGDGATQALGVFTASALGISTDRDVSTGNLTTKVQLEGLEEAKYAIKPQYWPKLRWLGSRTFHKQIYQLKDGEGRPLLVESTRTGELDRVLSFPISISEFAPSTFTTGQYVGILGDWFAGYWLAWGLDMDMQRLDELYAENNQVGFIGRMKMDAMPVLEECWSRVKLA